MAKYIKTEEGYKELEQIGAAITESVAHAQTTANNAQVTANNALTVANGKMNTQNPVGTGSFSMNRKANTTVGTRSHAEGTETTADGVSSHAEGNYTTASGDGSHAEGYVTTASGMQSHAEGHRTTASEQGAHAEGIRTTASGQGAHAEGCDTAANVAGSHAEGSDTIANGTDSHAEGSETTASGDNSHAEGSDTIANGNSSHTEGRGTQAYGVSSHVQGEYNIFDSPDTSKLLRGNHAHIVGNGTSDTERSNAHTLDWGGNAWYAGDVYIGSTSGTNMDEGSKKLATEEYVNEKLEAVDSPKGVVLADFTAEEDITSLILPLSDNPMNYSRILIEFNMQQTAAGQVWVSLYSMEQNSGYDTIAHFNTLFSTTNIDTMWANVYLYKDTAFTLASKRTSYLWNSSTQWGFGYSLTNTPVDKIDAIQFGDLQAKAGTRIRVEAYK